MNTRIPMIVNWPATWSKIQTFEKCPWEFYLKEGSKFITGKAEIPFATNKYMQRGEQKHDLYEQAAFSISNGCSIPDKTRQHPLWNDYVGNIITNLMAIYPNVSIEEKFGIDFDWRVWSVNKYWEPDKSLFDNRMMFLRTKLDLILLNADRWKEPTHAVVIDYKSGKARKAEACGQLGLYALTAFCRWPSLQRVDCHYIFVDHNSRQDEVYYSWNVPDLKAYFVDRILKIHRYLQSASTQIPFNDCNPSDQNCYWCPADVNQCPHYKVAF